MTVEIIISPIDGEAVLNAMKNRLQLVVNDLAKFCLAEAKKNLASGKFKGGQLNDETVPDGPGDRITFEGTAARSGRWEADELSASVIFDAPHVTYIEFGTKPRKASGPPLKPLENWVRLKLGISDEKLIKQVAFAIHLKIKKEGTSPKPFFRAAAIRTQSKTEINRILEKHGFSS